MGIEKGQKNIDAEQKKIDLLDKKEDEKVSDKKTDMVFKRLDDFQKQIDSSKEPDEVKAKQLKELGDLLATGNIENIEKIDKELGEKLKLFEAGLAQFENPNLYQVKDRDTLGKIVQEQLHVSLTNNPQLLFAGIKALQDYRDGHGSVLKISEDGVIAWDKGDSSPDKRLVGEYLDLSVLKGLTSSDNAGMNFYIARTSSERFKKGVTNLRDKMNQSVDVGEVVEKAKEDGTPKTPEEIQQLTDSDLMADFADIDTETLGFGKIKSREDFQKMIDGMTTDEERKEFLDNIMLGLQEWRDAKEEPSEQQKLRIKQAELISNVSLGISELFKESGGVVMKTIRFAGDEQSNARSAKKFTQQAQEFGATASKKILENPDKSLEELFPDLVSMFRHTGEGFLAGTVMGIPSIDFKEPKNVADLNVQQAEVMRFLMSVGSYKMVDTLGQEALKDDFDKAKEKMSEEKKTEITESANAKIAKDCEGYKAQWKEQGMTDEQITKFVGLMKAEQVDKDLTDYALLNHFDAKTLSADKKAVWDVYNETFDPQGEWLNITEDHFDYIVQEVLINAPLIVLSGGVASGLRGALSVGARSFLAGSRLAIAYEAGNVAVRGLALGAGLLAEGTAFEITHNALAVSIGLEEKFLYEMPDAMQKILWSTVTLGAFHGAGKFAEGVGKGIDQGLAKQVLRFNGVANPEQFKAVIDIVAKDISNMATRKVLQQLVISGNIEAATMLMIGAVQNGFYKGNLDDFFDNFSEELFHAYTAVGALKTSGHMTGKVMEGMKTKERNRDITTEKPPVKNPAEVKAESAKETTADESFKDGTKESKAEEQAKEVEIPQEISAELESARELLEISKSELEELSKNPDKKKFDEWKERSFAISTKLKAARDFYRYDSPLPFHDVATKRGDKISSELYDLWSKSDKVKPIAEFFSVKERVKKVVDVTDETLVSYEVSDLQGVRSIVEKLKLPENLVEEKTKSLAEIDARLAFLKERLASFDVPAPLLPLDVRIAEFNGVNFTNSTGTRSTIDVRVNEGGREGGKMVRVSTDGAVFVAPGRELITTGLFGCLAVFVKGPKGNALMHLTPSSKLGYSVPGEKVGSREIHFNHLEATMDLIRPELEKLGPVDQLEVTILGNTGNAQGLERPEMDNVVGAFRESGVKNARSVTMPFDANSSVAFLPQKSDSLFVKSGGKSEWVDLKIDKSVPTGLEQRLTKAHELLGRELSPSQREAVLKAHEVGMGGEGKFTKVELLEKARILDEAGFSKEERRKLMEEGITGYEGRVAAFYSERGGSAPYSVDENVIVPRSSGALAVGKIIKTSHDGREPIYEIRVQVGDGRTGLKTLTQAELNQYNRKYSEGMKVNTENGEATIVRRNPNGMYEVRMKDGSAGLFGEMYLDKMSSEKVEVAASSEQIRVIYDKRQEMMKGDFDKVARENPQPPVTTKILSEGWFKVQRVIEIDGQTFYMGPVTKGPHADSYLEAVGFVRVGNKMFPRLFYRSNSDGVWRSCSEKVLNRDQSGFTYKKGTLYTQETKLHPTINFYLEGSQGRPTRLAKEAGEHFQVGNDRKYDQLGNKDWYDSEVSIYRSKGLVDLTRVQPGHPKDSGILSEQMRTYLISARYPDGFIPDFQRNMIGKPYDVTHSLAGKAKGYDFSATLDGRPIEWKFVVDKSGRVWIESIKFTNAKTSSFGNYSEIIDSGFLTSKPFEYRDQVAGMPGRDSIELTPDVAANAPQNIDYGYQYVDQTPILSALAPIQAFKAALPYLK